MKIIRALGLVTAVVSAASWLDARMERQREQRRERERIDRTRWESEGGATPSGPHISESPPPIQGHGSANATTVAPTRGSPAPP
jgi:hypothetical protein